MSAPSAVALPVAKADAFASAPGSLNGLAGPDLYNRVAEAVRLYEDREWLAEHFQGDAEAAARYFEDGCLADMWTRFELAFDDLRRMHRHFPDRADWDCCAHNPRQLWEEFLADEVRARQKEEERLREEARGEDRQACDDFIEKRFRDRLLFHVRGGAWHVLRRVKEALAEHIPLPLARRRHDAEHGRGHFRPAKCLAEARSLLCDDAVALVQRLKLLEVRTTAAGEVEVRSTPWEDPRFRLDDEFAHFLPRNPDDVAALEEQILAEGCQDPLIVWEGHGILVDGYTRYAPLMLLGRPFEIVEKEFADREAVKTWLWNLHRGRRNMNRETKSYHRGREYLALKKPHGGDRRSGRSSGKTCQMLAERYHSNAKTIRNDAHFTADLDKLADLCGGAIRDWVLAQGGHGSAAKVHKLLTLAPEEMRRIVEAILASGTWPKPWPTACPGKRSRSEVCLPGRTLAEKAQAVFAYLGPDKAPLFHDHFGALLGRGTEMG
jgi:hypothetical protein